MAEDHRCQQWLPAKSRRCANAPLPNSRFCGNHDPRSGDRRVPCPVDPSHAVLKENLESHIKRCPLKKQAAMLESQPYYSKGFNTVSGDPEEGFISSEAKRNAVHKLSPAEFRRLLDKIVAIHSAIAPELKDSYASPGACACARRLNQQLDGNVPYQEKHAAQQASILGNMEMFGILLEPAGECEEGKQSCSEEQQDEFPAVVEFGAGRGYLAHMLADCYGAKKVFLVERRSYKLKADRTLRQQENVDLERLRIDIEDLNMQGIESLRDLPYLAVGKHLCGPATDLAIICSLQNHGPQNETIVSRSCYLQGLALATCCHHLCQWKHYTTDRASKLALRRTSSMPLHGLAVGL